MGTLMARLAVALVAIVALSIIGYYVAQYKPFTGGTIVAQAEPYSAIRNQVAYQYAVAGGVSGLILALLAQAKRSR